MIQGDIVILDFPFADSVQSKWRPAVVLSNDRYNLHANVLLAGLYGKHQPLSVGIGKSDVQSGELTKESYVSLQNIFSADKSLIRGTIAGSLTHAKMKEVLAELSKCVS